MGLLDGEQMRDVAVGIDLLEPAAGRGDGPGQRSLAAVAPRSEMQALHAVLDGALVAIAGHVADVQLHAPQASAGGTRKSEATRSPRSRRRARNCCRK